jgi:addiction module RelE/StbE family toxin
MEIIFHRTFRQQYKKVSPKVREQFCERLQLWQVEPTHPSLRAHSLKGKYAGYWSMSVTGDFRALYKEEGNEIIIFAFIGTHSQLYGK